MEETHAKTARTAALTPLSPFQNKYNNQTPMKSCLLRLRGEHIPGSISLNGLTKATYEYFISLLDSYQLHMAIAATWHYLWSALMRFEV